LSRDLLKNRFAIFPVTLWGAPWGALVIASLSACLAPMKAPEAQSIARDQLAKYCRKGGCGAYTLGRTQKIKDRWLVDFEAPRHRFTVTVEDNGSAKVTTWDK
jgi:hypothetical protein